MEITVLASGSKGNCTLVSGEDGALLVDCGLPVREVLSRLSAAGYKD
ncbi:MAG: MBL fold metallo-hydrolase, partial [Methanomicrobiales archaeon]|nr:MBL fold metallo-hydrolase [Methanomicrobiales archaeon]